MSFLYEKARLQHSRQKLIMATTPKTIRAKPHIKVYYNYYFIIYIGLGVCYSESRKLKLKHYLDCLFEGKSFQAVNRGFKTNKHHQMMYYEQPKEGLNPVFMKFDLEDDLITCKPLKRDGQYL